MKLLVIFDQVDSDVRPRFARSQEQAVEILQQDPIPAAYRVHQHQVGNDVDTIVSILTGEFTWPTPQKAWKVRNSGQLLPITACGSCGATDDDSHDRNCATGKGGF